MLREGDIEVTERAYIDDRCPGDLLCRIFPHILTSIPQTEIAHASAKNVSDAARALIQECVIRRRIGGSVKQIGEVATVQICSNGQPVSSSLSRAKKVNIGGDDKLAVAVTHARGVKPTCTENVTTPPSSCKYIMDDMYKIRDNELFGHAGSGKISVALPLTLRARE